MFVKIPRFGLTILIYVVKPGMAGSDVTPKAAAASHRAAHLLTVKTRTEPGLVVFQGARCAHSCRSQKAAITAIYAPMKLLKKNE